MTYEEFVTYASAKLRGVLSDQYHFWSDEQRARIYFKACSNALYDCAAFLEKLQADEGVHNDYNPNSNVASKAYRKDLSKEIAIGFGSWVKNRSSENHEVFLERVTRGRWRRGQIFSRDDYCRAFIKYHSCFRFYRTCKCCGEVYVLIANLQTYSVYVESASPTCVIKQSEIDSRDKRLESELKEISHLNILKRWEMGRAHKEKTEPTDD